MLLPVPELRFPESVPTRPLDPRKEIGRKAALVQAAAAVVEGSRSGRSRNETAGADGGICWGASGPATKMDPVGYHWFAVEQDSGDGRRAHVTATPRAEVLTRVRRGNQE